MSTLQNSFLPFTVPNRQLSLIKRRRSAIIDSRLSDNSNSGKAVASPVVAKDWELIQQAVAGDSHAREELFAAHSARIYRTAYSLLRNKEDAEDAMQDSLCNAFTNLGSFKGQSSFSTWLTRIVINSALMIRRKRTRRGEASLDEIVESKPERLRHQVVHAGPNPEEICAINQNREMVSEQIRRLPVRVRAAFQLRALKELSVAESCQSLGVGRATLKARVFRARKQLVSALRQKMLARRKHQPLELDGSRLKRVREEL